MPSSMRGPTFTKPIYFDRAASGGWICNVCMPSRKKNLKPMSAQAAMNHERNSSNHAKNVSDSELWDPTPNDSWVIPQDDAPLTAEELKARTKQVHVDQVRDMVPFWMKAVEAAQKGEVLRLEDFLEKLAAQDRWGVAELNDPWGPSIGPWPADHPWGAVVPGGEQDPWEKMPDDPWGRVDNDPWGKADDDPWGKVADWGADEDSTLSFHADRTVSDHRGNGRDKGIGKGKGKGNRLQNDKAKQLDPYSFVEDIARQQAADAERKKRMHDFYNMSTHDKVRKIEEMVRNLRTISA